MKDVLCPRCRTRGVKSLLARSEMIKGSGYILLWCKKCKKEIRIDIKDIAE